MKNKTNNPISSNYHPMVTAYSNILPQMKGVNYENTIIVLSKYVDDRFEKLFYSKDAYISFIKIHMLRAYKS